MEFEAPVVSKNHSSFHTPHFQFGTRGPSSPTTGRSLERSAGTGSRCALGIGKGGWAVRLPATPSPRAKLSAQRTPTPTARPAARGTDDAPRPACPRCLSNMAGPVVHSGPPRGRSTSASGAGPCRTRKAALAAPNGCWDGSVAFCVERRGQSRKRESLSGGISLDQTIFFLSLADSAI